MLTLFQSVALFSAAVVAYGLWKVTKILIRPWTSSLRYVPGPSGSTWLRGHMRVFEVFERREAQVNEWVDHYGITFRFKGPFNTDRLWTIDSRALNHILTHSTDYPKPEMVRTGLAALFGQGLLFAEGDHHRRQRRVMNPAFGPSQVRDFADIFWRKAFELRDVWNNQASSQTDSARVDVFNGLNKMTLDVIGLAGFNYSFDSLNVDRKPDELYVAFRTVFNFKPSFSIINLFLALFPFLRPYIRTDFWTRATHVRKLMNEVGRKVLNEKREEFRKTAGLEAKNVQDRDLLTLLIKANMATDLPESQRLSDEDVVDQVPTFLVAGHETTSTATTWCLHALTLDSGVQRKLREELLSVPTDTPSVEELSALPYLDAVVRETMRLYSPVEQTMREAGKDDVIPLSAPYTDSNGVTHDSLRIDKGTYINIPIRAINMHKPLWGEDADQFRPERWESLPEAVQAIPGVWGNMLSFLGGPRSCIGYRFALVEMKVLLFTLIRAFEFEAAVPVEDIKKVFIIVTRPLLESENKKGNQLPMFVKPYQAN